MYGKLELGKGFGEPEVVRIFRTCVYVYVNNRQRMKCKFESTVKDVLEKVPRRSVGSLPVERKKERYGHEEGETTTV